MCLKNVFFRFFSKRFAGFFIVFLLATLLRHHALTQKSFWLDETFTLLRSTPQPFSNFFREVQLDNHPPLYYFCVLQWRKLLSFDNVSSEDYGVRWLSVVFSLASLGLFYALGKKRFSPKEQFWALTLFAFSPLHLLYAQEARHYSMSVFFALLQHWSFLKLLERPESVSPRFILRWSFLYTFSLVGGFYCFLYLLFVLPIHFLFWGEKAHRQRSYRVYPEIIWSWIVALLLFSPWLYYVVFEKAKTFASFRASTFIYENHSLSETFWRLFAGFFSWEHPIFSGMTLFIGYGILGLMLFLGWKYRLGFSLSALIVPFICLLLLPIKPHYFDPKHLLFATPFAFFILAKLETFSWGRVFLILLLGLELMGIVDYFHPKSQKENWSAVAQQVVEVAESHGLVVVNPIQFLFPLQRYLEPLLRHPLRIIGYQGAPDEMKLMSLFSNASQVIWIQAQNPVSTPYPILPALLQNYQEISSFETEGYFGTIWISVFQKK